MAGQTTNFGFQKVSTDEKAARVDAVFDSVASRYDLMNDLMSFGVHRLWKRFAIDLAAVRPGERVLDLAAGTGDLSEALARRAGPEGQLVMGEINASMLEKGRDRLIDAGTCGNVTWVQSDAQQLPFPDQSFDCITIAFGLRNVVDPGRALASMARVLRPGGRVLVLEFSHPREQFLSKAYDLYSFNVLPALGKLITGDADSYRYLAESIRVHPDQETLRETMVTAGLEQCEYFNLSGGIVAVHRGYRF